MLSKLIANERVLLKKLVMESYANNNFLYEYMEKRAELKELVAFLLWDSVQPPFAEYLERWVPRVPAYMKEYLVEHVEEERGQGKSFGLPNHTTLFNLMVNNLKEVCPVKVELDEVRLKHLNYPFSEECASLESVGYFVGTFFTTELMTAKRSRQIYDGLRRLGISDDGVPRQNKKKGRSGENSEFLHKRYGTLKFMEVHGFGDEGHAEEVLDELFEPLVQEDYRAITMVREGVMDRMSRSGQYLRWYAKEFLPKS